MGAREDPQQFWGWWANRCITHNYAQWAHCFSCWPLSLKVWLSFGLNSGFQPLCNRSSPGLNSELVLRFCPSWLRSCSVCEYSFGTLFWFWNQTLSTETGCEAFSPLLLHVTTRMILEIFKLWVLEKTLESPLNCKEIKPVNPKRNPPWILIGRIDAKAEAPILGHLIWRANSLEKTLMLGKIEGKRRRGWQRMRWLDGIINSMDMNLSKLQEIVKDGGAWHAVVQAVTKGWHDLVIEQVHK